MKAYNIWTNKWDYDEYDAFVVVAKDKDSALARVKNFFKDYQLPHVYVEEIDLTVEHIVLESFNAG